MATSEGSSSVGARRSPARPTMADASPAGHLIVNPPQRYEHLGAMDNTGQGRLANAMTRRISCSPM